MPSMMDPETLLAESTKTNVALRDLTSTDLPAVAHIHIVAFPKSILTTLGSGAVCRYYDWQLNGPHEVTALGVFHDTGLLGFCFGGIFRGALSGFLRRNRLFLFGRICTRPWILATPQFRKRLPTVVKLIQNQMNQRTTGIRSYEPKPRSFGILSIAVRPECQGQGIGHLLMTEMEAKARADGFIEMGLTVDSGNQPAIAFYKAHGWDLISMDDQRGGKMRKSLSGDK